VTLVEASPSILGNFDRALVDHYAGALQQRGVDLRTSTGVTEVPADDVSILSYAYTV
jgi:NADH dehydrogenase FAD-containing subunit